LSIEQVHELLAARRVGDALGLLSTLNERSPKDPSLWRLRGQILLRQQQVEAGLACLKTAAERAGPNAEYWLEYGHTLFRSGRRRAALEAALSISKMTLSQPALWDALGTLLTYCEEAGEACPCFETAVAAAPKNVGYRYNLAMAQRMLGRFADAERNLEAVVVAHPDDYTAYSTLADLRTQTREHNHVAAMEAAARKLTDPRKGISLFFALAKELEDLEEYPRSFDYLKRGCDIHRRQFAYDVNEDVAVLKRLTQRHTRQSLAVGTPGTHAAQPIFVLGLPRSGTTLVERILASHPEVEQAGELQSFPLETIKAVQRAASRQASKVEFVELSLGIDPGALGEAYLAAARPPGRESTRFTDKLPLNYLYAGLIRRALPDAPIVALRRGAMDSCYAMYKALFTSAYPFTYDLQELARYYVAWRELMDHWESVLGDAWLTISYEDLVANQEEVTRRLLVHCRLEWNVACLHFHTQKTAVSTASAVQVRRALNADSIGRWRHYEPQLAPLRDYFLERGVPLD